MLDANTLTEYIQDVIITIHQNVAEIRNRKTFAASEELTHIEAKLIAYQEVISILKLSAREFGIADDDLGI